MNTENVYNYSSKVKRVNIELPNYEFFHSPSQKGKIDNVKVLQFVEERLVISFTETINKEIRTKLSLSNHFP